MPSIHRQPGKPNWFCAYSVYENGRARRVFRSTKTSNKKQAQEICRVWHKAALKARNGKLSADAAREIITAGVADVFLAANAESLSSATVGKWCETWLQTKSIEAEQSTHARYARIIERLVEFLGAKAGRDLPTLQAVDITRFRDREAKELSCATANLSLKVLRVCFGEAVRQDLLEVNPALRVKVLKSKDKSARRAFSIAEIKRILRACADDAEWRGLILFGLYLGQRLGDVSKLTWRAVNLEAGEIAFTTRKTGRRMVLPLPQPLLDYLASLPATDEPNAYIFPRAAAATRTGTLSNQFREILVGASLAEPRSHEATGKGRSRAPRDIGAFLPQLAPLSRHPAEGERRQRRDGERTRRPRERSRVAPVHTPLHRRPAQSHAAVAGRDGQLMKLRKFKKWSPRRVEEVVRMLYEKQRFDIDKSLRHWRELKWKELVRRACQYLDEVDEAYAEIAKERAKMDAEYRGAEARAAEAEAEAEDLPDPVPVEKALRVITGRDRTTLAESNFASGGSAAAFRSARRWNCERSTSRSGRASKGDRAT